MRRLVCVVAALIGLASPALATGYEETTRSKYTLGTMFTQSGSFGFPPHATDPFACNATVTAERTIYYNTTFHSIVYCNGSTWTTLGTSSGLSSPVAGDYVWTGKQTFGSGVDGANTVRVGDTAGAIVFEGSSADAFETTLGVTDPTADVRFNLPAPTAGTYSLLSTAAAITMAQGGTDVTTASDDQVLVSSGSAWVAKTVPDCTDSAGNHLNYTQSTNAFSCGTSGGISSPVSGDIVWTGKQTFGSAADAANSVRLGETAGGIVFEGATLDAFETTLAVTDPTADVTFTLPAPTAGTYGVLTTAAAVTLAQGGTGLTSAADDTVPVSSGTAWVAKALPACTDTGGNHLNYDQASNAFSCGTSSSATLTSPVAGDLVWTGKQTFGSAADAANSVRVGEDAGKITFEGATVDAFETRLSVVDPTADVEYQLPNAAAGTYTIMTSANPTALDGSFKIQNTADPTRQAAFSAAGIGAGTTKTYTLPNVSGTVAIVTGIDQYWGGNNNTFTYLNVATTESFTSGTRIISSPWDTPVGGTDFAVGTATKSIRLKTSANAANDQQNGPCGASACADPTFVWFSHNNTTTEWFSAVHDGTNGLLQVGTGAVAVQPGSGTGRALVGGALNTNVTPVGNGADVTEDVLMTYSLPSNSLTVNSRGVEIHAWGTTANNTDTKTLKCYFGATAIMTQALTVSIAGVWDVRATVLRTGAATEEAIATLASQGAAGVAMSTVLDTQPNADTTGAITISCTGQANATNANDIKQNGMTVMYIN
jgi:hypothetical protein